MAAGTGWHVGSARPDFLMCLTRVTHFPWTIRCFCPLASVSMTKRSCWQQMTERKRRVILWLPPGQVPVGWVYLSTKGSRAYWTAPSSFCSPLPPLQPGQQHCSGSASDTVLLLLSPWLLRHHLSKLVLFGLCPNPAHTSLQSPFMQLASVLQCAPASSEPLTHKIRR